MTEPRKALFVVAIMAAAVVGAQVLFRVAAAPLREVLRLPGLDMPATPHPVRPPVPRPEPAAPPPPRPLAEGGIFGRILAAGEPVPGVEVEVRLEESDLAKPEDPRRVRTAEGGTYRIPFLLPGRTYRVLVAGAEPRLVTLPSEGGDLRVDLESAAHPAEQVPGPAGIGVPGPGAP